ncbi:MAG: DUF4062 domain-containing protein [Sandaracinaceae bacterium]|nr:DUF4062 domain-containing protein [Sandaracinaceae bacterium]
MSQRLVVFLSSTVEDLDAARRAIRDALEARGADVRTSEAPDFPVEPGVTSHDACLRAVRGAHVFVLLVGSRFGGEYQRQNKSITWREWEEAMDAKLLPIVLVRADTNALARALGAERAALVRRFPDERVVDIDARLRADPRFADAKPDRHNLPGVQRFIDTLRKGHVDNWVHLDWDGTPGEAVRRIDARLTAALAVARAKERPALETAERERLRLVATQEVSALAARLAVHVATGERTLADAAGLLLAGFALHAGDLLGYGADDRHNFVVYRRDGDVLKVSARAAHPAIPVHGRSWRVGQGHVGLSVSRDRLLVGGDIRHGDAWIPAEARPADGDHYVSAVSVPFTFRAGAAGPDGALIVTSSRLDHFRTPSQIEVLTVGTLANMVTMLHASAGERA